MSKNSRSKYQRSFRRGFTGKGMGLGKPEDKGSGKIHGQDQSRAARDKRRKAREAKKK